MNNISLVLSNTSIYFGTKVPLLELFMYLAIIFLYIFNITEVYAECPHGIDGYCQPCHDINWAKIAACPHDAWQIQEIDQFTTTLKCDFSQDKPNDHFVHNGALGNNPTYNHCNDCNAVCCHICKA